MAKQYKVLVNTGKAENNKAIDVQQYAGDKGQPVRIKAQAGTKYQLQELGKDKGRNTAPDYVKAKRNGKNLEIAFENGTSPDLIIEGYYDEMPAGYNGLIGQAENGSYYEYIPEDPNPQGLIPELADGARPVNVALGAAEVSPAGAAVGVLAFPLLAPLGLLGAGAAALAAANNAGTNTPVVTGALQAAAPNDSGTLGDNRTNDSTPTLTGTVPAGSTATITINGQIYPVTVNADGTWSFTQPTNLPDGTYTPVLNVTTNGVTTATPITPFTIDTVTNVDITNPGSAGTLNPISGTAEPGDTIVVKDSTGKVIGTTTAAADGKWSITPTSAVPAGTITATATDAAGNTATDTDSAATTSNSSKTALSIDPISDNVILASEQGVANYTVTGKVTGVFKTGDTVNLTLNGKNYTTTVAADGSYSMVVPMADLLADPDTKIEGKVTGTGGDTATAAQDYTVEASNTTAKTALSINPVTADNILSASENTGSIAITGKVTGKFAAGDTVTLTVNGKTFTGKAAADGSYSIAVPAADLSSDTDTTVDGTVTGTGGTTATAIQDYGLDTASQDGLKTALTINPITGDNIVTANEQGAATIPVTGKVTGTFAAGDVVQLTLNGKIYTAPVAADGSYTAYVSPADIKQDADTKIEGVVIGTGGDKATASQDYTLEAGNTPTQTALSLDPVTTDNILSPTEAAGTVNISGKVTGPFSPNDTVTVMVNGKPYTGKPSADGTFSIPVPGSELAADPNTTIEATVTGTGGTPAAAMQDYGVGTSTNGGLKTALSINPITGDNIVTANEQGAATIPVTGKVTGTFAAGDLVTLTLNGKLYTATVAADGSYTANVAMSDLKADSDTKIEGTVTGTNGDTATAAQDYTFEAGNTPTQTALSLDPVTTDNILSPTEAAGTVNISGKVTGPFSPNDTVTVMVNGKPYTGKPSADGTFSIPVPGSELAADPNTTIEATVTGTGGTPAAAMQDYGVGTTTPSGTTTGALSPTSDNNGDGITNPQDSDNITKDPTPDLSGTVPTGSTATVTLNGQTYPVTVNPDGTWNFTQPTNLPDGTYYPVLNVTTGGVTKPTNLTPFTIDTTPPTIAITSSANALGAGQTATITFTLSEVVSDFTAADITVTGGTLGTLVQSTTDPKVWTAVFTPTAGTTPGSATISVASAKFSDAAGNFNTDGAEANNTVTLTTNASTTGGLDPNAVNPNGTPNDSGAKGDNLTNDPTPTLSGKVPAGSTAQVDINGTKYPVNVNPDGTWSFTNPTNLPDGTYTPQLIVTPQGSSTPNAPVPLTPFTIDTTPPTVAITSSATALTSGQTAAITFTLSETSSDFTAADVVVSGGTLSNFQQSATNPLVYTATFTPASTGTSGVISIASDKFADAAANTNKDGADANNTVNLSINATTTGQLSPASDNATGTPNDNKTNDPTPELTGKVPAGSTATVTINGQTYPVNVNPDGTYTFTQPTNLPDGTYTPVLNVTTNGQTTSTPVTPFTVDTTPPTVAITSPVTTLAAGASTTLTFTVSEATTDLTIGDIQVTGGTLGPLQQSATNPLVYTATFMAAANATGASTASVSIASNKFTDAAGNNNTDGADTNNTWTWTVNSGSKLTALTIDPITGDNIISTSESGATSVTVTGKVTGTFVAGDKVTLVLNGTPYVTAVAADGSYSVSVAMSDLKADADTKIEGSVTGTGGSAATAAQDYQVQSSTNPRGLTGLSIDPVTADNVIGQGEDTGNITITGTVTGAFSTTDTVTLTLNGKAFTAKPAADGTYSVSVPAADLVADADTKIEGTITGTGGTVADAIQDYAVNPAIGPDPSTKTALYIDPISSDVDNILTLSEQGNAITKVTGFVSGKYAAGDKVTLSINGSNYLATVAADGTWSVDVATTDLVKDADTKVEGTVTGTGGSTATAAQDYVVQTSTNIGKITALSIDPVTEDNLIDATEAGASTIAVTGQVTGAFSVNDTVTLTINGKTYTGKPNAQGVYSINVPTADLIADKDTTIDGTVTGTGGTKADAMQDYALSSSVNPVEPTNPDPYNPANTGGTTAISIDAITGDNVLTTTESGTINVTGKVSGAFAVNDTVTLYVNGYSYTGKVLDTAGNYSIPVKASDLLSDKDTKIEADVTGTGGDKATAQQDYIIEANPAAPAQTTLTIDRVTGDNFITASEKTGSINVTGTVGGKFAVGDTVTLMVNDKPYTGKVLSAAGNYSIAVPAADLLADSDSNIDGSVSGTGGTIATAKQNYAIEAPTPTGTTTGALSPTSDNNNDGVTNPQDSDNITKDPTPELSGTVPTGSTATVTINDITYPVTVKPDGTWSFTQPTNLPDGTYYPVLNVTTGGVTKPTNLTPFTIDTTPPTVIVTSSSTALATGKTATITFTLSEASSDFALEDITVTGGTLSALTQSATDPKVYTATFTPLNSSVTSATISVPSDRFADAAGNKNADGAEANNTVTLSTNAATTGGLSPASDNNNDGQTNPQDSDNQTSDPTPTFGGTVPPGTTSAKVKIKDAEGNVVGEGDATLNPDGTWSYTQPTNLPDGTYTPVLDTVTNGTPASTPLTPFTIDTTPPKVEVTSSATVLASGQTAAITFTLSEASSDFTSADVAVTGGTLSNFAQSATNPLVYTATFTPNSTGSSGTVSIASDRFADAAGNLNKDGLDANNTVSLTTNAPVTGQLSPASDNATGTPNDNKTNDPTPELSGKVPAGSTATVTINGVTYPVDVKPDGTYTFTQPTNLPDGTYTPVLNVTTNGQTSSTPVTPFTVDTTAPTIAISDNTTTLTAGQSTQVTFTLSEASSDFTLADISVTGGTLSALTQSPTNPLVYTATFTAATNAATGSTVSLKVDSSKFSDAAGNQNADGAEANNIWAYTVTAAAPVTPTNPDPYNPANTGGKTAISIDAITGDNVMAANDTGNINVTGKVSGTFAVNDTVTLYVNGTTYTGKVLDTAGNYSIAVKASDLLADKDSKIEADVTGTGGDKATAQQDYIVEANPSAPTQTALSIDPITGDNFIAATEKTGTLNVTGKVSGKFAVGDTVTLMVNDKAYTGKVLDAAGNYSIAVPATDVALDADTTITGTVVGTGGSAANAMQNYALDTANPVTPTTDTTPPTIVVARTNTSAGLVLDANAKETITFTLSEASTTFDASDIVVTGGTLSNFVPVPTSGTAATGYTQYTAVFTPAAGSNGTATIGVASGKFSDNAGNANQDTYLSPAPSGATSESNNKVDLAYDTRNTSPANVDTDKPTVQVSIDKTTLASGQSATLSFILSEPSTDFALADIDVISGGGQVTNLQPVPGSSGTQYTATYTAGSTAGNVVIGVDAAKFSDAAGNTNADTYKGSATGTSAVSGTSAETNNWVSLTNTGSTDATAPTVVVSRTGSGTVGSAGETVVFTLSEASTTFTSNDVTVTGGTLTNWSAVAGSNGTQYTATFVPTSGSSGSATVGVASGVFADASGNANKDTNVNPAPAGATYEANNQVVFTVDAGTNPAPTDTTAPTIAITADKTTLSVGETAKLTFTLSEASSDFIQSDVSVTGGSLSNWTQVNPSTWTATYTPNAGSTGTGSVSVASNTFSDAAANYNTDGADANNTVSFVTNNGVLPTDTTPPTIEVKRLGSGTLSGTGGETIEFTLSEASKDFTLADITFTGGTLSNLAAVPTSGSAGTGYTTYVATFTPAANSTTPATIGVLSNKFSDAAGNYNKDTYTNPATGTDVYEANNLVTIPVNTLSPSTDTTTPTVVVARAGSGTLAVNATETITFTLSEPSLTFDSNDVTVTGGQLTNWTMVAASGTPSTGYTVYTATFVPTAGTSGTATIGVQSDKFTDAAGNNNKDTYQSGVAGTTYEANNQVSIGFDTTSPSKDTTSPTVEVVRTGTGTITGPETIYFNFSEASTDFALADISVSGGTMSNLVAVAGSGNKQYIATFTPTASTTGTATIGVKAATFSDAAGNKNKDTFDANDSATGAVQEANNQVSASFDTVPPNPIDQTPPTVAISRDGSGAVGTSGAKLVFVFSEPVTGFIATDIVDTTNGSAATGISNLQEVAGSGGTQYTATWTPPTGSVGTITLGVKAGTFADATGNQNLDTYSASADSVPGHIVEANNQLTLAWNTDTTAPTIIVSSSATTLAGSNTATITFTLSEAGVDFTESDVVVTGGTLSNFQQSSTNPLVYTATFTANSNSQGTATIGVAANAFKDLAGNANTDDYNLTRGVDDTNSKVDISYDTRNGTFAVANDTGSTTEGASASTVATPVTGNVLTNDSQATTVTAVGAGAGTASASNLGTTLVGTYGTLTLQANGSYSYTLDNSKPSVQALKDGDKVTDIFTSTASGVVSGTTQSGNANLVITITGVNDAPVAVADTASAVEAGGNANGTPGTNPSGNVLTNDSDIDTADTRTVSALNGSTVSAATATADTTGISGSYGKLYIGTDGSYRYEVDQTNATVQARLPGSPALTDTFTYTVRDAAGATSTATLTVNINGANDAPTVASPIADKTATAGTAITAFSVDSHFADVDTVANGETATYSATLADGSPLPGWLSINPSTGQFSGTPPANTPAGTLSIKAIRTDAGGLSASDTFNIVIAAAPDTTPPTIAITSNQASLTAGQTATITFTFSEAVQGFGDAGDIEVLGGTLNNSGGTTTLAPDASSGNATDGYTRYTATFTPTASYQGAGYVRVGAGKFTDMAATPNANVDTYVGATAQEDLNNIVNFTVDTTVASNLTLINDSAAAKESGVQNGGNTAETGTNPSGNVLTNDTAASSVTQIAAAGAANSAVTSGTTSASNGTSVNGQYGTLVMGADGSYTYTLKNSNATVNALPNGSTLTEVFTYTARDASGATKTANLTITITGTNDAPVAAADTASAVEQGGSTASPVPGINPSGNVLTNDTDVDTGDAKTVSAILAGTTGTATSVTAANASAATGIAGTYGTLKIGTDGSYIYAVDNANATVQALLPTSTALIDTFTYTVRDAAGATHTHTLTVTVQGANDAPQVQVPLVDQTVAIGSALFYTWPGNANAGTDTFRDVDTGHQAALTYTASLADGSSLPAWLSFNASTRTFSGSPPAGTTLGDITVKVTATDALGLSTSDDFRITVGAAPAASLKTAITIDPVTGDNVILSTENTGNITVTGKVSGAFATTDTVTVTINDQVLTTTPDANGNYSVSVAASDLAADTDTKIEATVTGTGGSTATAAQDYVLEAGTTPTQTALVIDKVTADNIVNATEGAGSVNITGKVTGKYASGDTVTLMVNGKSYTGTALADGSYTIAVAGSDLLADADTTIDGIVTGTGGTTARAAQNYGVDTSVPTNASSGLNLGIRISTDADDDKLVSTAELNSATDFTSVITFDSSKAVAGDTVVVTATNGTGTPTVVNHVLTAAEASAGTFSLTFAKPAEGQLQTVTANYVDKAGNAATDTPPTDNAKLDTTAPTNADVGLAIAISTDSGNDGKVSIAELNGAPTFTSRITVNNTAQVGDQVIISATNGSVAQTPITHTLTANDISNGFDVTFAKPADGATQVVTASYVDAAGNAATDTPPTDSARLDATRPSITISTDASTLSANQTATITFTLSEAGTDFNWNGLTGDITLTGGGLLSALSAPNVTAGQAIYTATYTPPANTTASATISVASDKFNDASGNANRDGADPDNSVLIAINTGSAPSSNASATIDITTIVDATFASQDTGASASDFITQDRTLVYTGTITNWVNTQGDQVKLELFDQSTGSLVTGGTATITPASDGSWSWNNVANSRADGTYVLRATIVNSSGNPVNATAPTLVNGNLTGGGYDQQVVIIDNAASNLDIQLLTLRISTDGNNDGGVTATELASASTFTSRASFDGTKAKVGEKLTFTASNGSTTLTPIERVLDATDLANGYVDVTFAKPAEGETQTVAVKFTDLAGNLATDTAPTDNAKLDSTPPTIAISASPTTVGSGQGSNTSLVTFTLSEASTTFGAGDVVATGGTLSGFTGSGTSYTATFTPDGTATSGSVSVASGTFSDTAGNQNADGNDANNTQALTINVAPVASTTSLANPLTLSTGPEVTITDNVAGSATNGQTVTYTLTFSEAISAASLTESDLSVNVGSLVSNSLTKVNDTTWTVQATVPATGVAVQSLTVANGSYTSTSGTAGMGGVGIQAYGTATTVGGPEISGAQAQGVVPSGWTMVKGSPDILDPTTTTHPWATSKGNMEGTSLNGNTFAAMSTYNSEEQMGTTLTGLTPGQTYTFGVQWQQIKVTGSAVGTERIGGSLLMTVNGTSQLFTSSGVTDSWQTATMTFVATGTTASVVLAGENTGATGTLYNGIPLGFIGVDSLTAAQITPGDANAGLTLTGTTAADTNLIGADGNDTITAAGGADNIYAGGGNDVITLNTDNVAQLTGAGAMVVDGGSGINRLVIANTTAGTATAVLDLTKDTTLAKLRGINTIDITGPTSTATNNTVKLDYNAVTKLAATADVTTTAANESKMVLVQGNAGDTLQLAGTWTAGASTTGSTLAATYGSAYGFVSGTNYTAYTLGDATVFVASTMTVSNNQTSTTAAGTISSQAVTIESLFGPTFSDANTTTTIKDFMGVAITSAGSSTDLSSKGKYQISTNGGTSWTDLAAGLTDATAIYADKTALIRFVEASGVIGAVPQDLTVRLVDGYAVTANHTTGSTVNVSTNGGMTAYSGNTVTLSQTPVQDTTAPGIVVTSSANTLGVGQTATITFSLSEPSTTFDANDVTVSGGTLSNFQGSGNTYTATFTPTPNTASGSATISVASGKFTDAAGNANADGAEANNTTSITYDTVAPVFSSAATSALLEGQPTATEAYNATADGDVGVTYTLSGTDAALFDINASTGVVTFKTTPVYATPTDSGANNVYDVVVTATDATGNATNQNVAITVVQQPTLNLSVGAASGAFATSPTVSGGGLRDWEPKIATTTDGGYVVVWRKEISTENYKVVYQKFDASHNKVGSEVEVSGWGSGGEPQVTAMADGGFVIVSGNGFQNLYVNRYDSSNTLVSSTTLNPTNTYNVYADVAALNDGGYVVSWTNLSDIYVQRYSSTNTAVGSTKVIDGASTSDRDPLVVATPDNGYVVVWSTSNPTDIFVQKFGSDNNPVGSEVALNNPNGGTDQRPDVTVLKDGSYVVTWEWWPNNGDGNVYVQKFNSNGTTAGSMITLSGPAANVWDKSSSVTALNDGGYVVAWSGYVGGTSTSDLFIQRYDKNNVAVGTMKQVQGSDSSDELPEITATTDGGYVVVWHGMDVATNQSDVYAQKYDASNNPVGPEQRLSGVTNGGTNDHLPQVTALPNGGYAVTWYGSNPTNSATDIFVEAFDGAGVPAGSTGTGTFNITSSLSNLPVSETVTSYVATYTGGTLTVGGTAYASGATIPKATWDAAVAANTVLLSNASATNYSFTLVANVTDSNSGLAFQVTVNKMGTGLTSPLVIDLNGDGVQTLGLDHGVVFDLSGTGQPVKTAWVDHRDGLLAIDRNHDGQINSGVELFGTGTVLANGAKAADGWAALAGLDTNADGVINAMDAQFADLRVWRDADGDGVTDAGELVSLQDAGIASISLAHDQAVTAQNGNLLIGQGAVTHTNGTTTQVTDAWLATEKLSSVEHPMAEAPALDGSLATLNLVGLNDVQLSLDNLGATLANLSGNAKPDLLHLNVSDVLQLPTTAAGVHQLEVLGDANDVVDLSSLFADGHAAGQWAANGQVTQNGHTFNVYQYSGDQTLQVLIDQHIVQSNVHLS